MKSTLINTNIGGLAFSYSILCPRKLWLYENNINLEETNENVRIGKNIEENYYKREKKNVLIDGINIDYLDNGVIYEIKKSSHSKDYAINQIKYYLYCLEKKGMENISGILKIPTERYQEKVVLTKEDRIFIEEQLMEIEKILNGDIPKVERKKICSKCAYYEFCYIEE